MIPDGLPTEMRFSEIDIPRAQLIHELQVDFGVNDEGVGVILNLADQLYSMRRALMQLRDTGRKASERVKT